MRVYRSIQLYMEDRGFQNKCVDWHPIENREDIRNSLQALSSPYGRVHHAVDHSGTELPNATTGPILRTREGKVYTIGIPIESVGLSGLQGSSNHWGTVHNLCVTNLHQKSRIGY